MATIKDVALKAGVSIATVSHVINRTRYVSNELEMRVTKAMNELNYNPTDSLRISKKAKTQTIGIITTAIGDELLNDLVQGLDQLLPKEKLYQIVTLLFKGNKLTVKDIKNYQQHYNLDHIIIYDCLINENFDQKFNPKFPIISIGQKQAICHNAFCIDLDYEGGLEKSLKHLIRSGHEEIGIITYHGQQSFNERLRSKTNQLFEQFGLPHKHNLFFEIGKSETEDTYRLFFEDVLKTSKNISSIITMHPNIMIKLLEYANQQQIKIPDDISVVSVGGFITFPLMHPSITHVSIDIADLINCCIGYIEEVNTNQISKISSNLIALESSVSIARGPFGEKAQPPQVLELTSEEVKLLKKSNYSVAVSFHCAGNVWARLHEQGMKDCFNNLGIKMLAVTNAHFDPELQSIQQDGLLSMKPNAIVSIPVDEIKTAESYKRIAESNTKLVLINNVPEGLTQEDYATCISVNEMENGRIAARILGKHMLETGRSNFGMVNHGAAFFATKQRDLTVENTMKNDFPSLNLVAKCQFHNLSNVYDVCREMILQHPEIQSLYVCWEEPAQQVLKALKSLGREDITIVTTDLDYEVALNIARGGNIIGLSAQRPYEQGRAMALAVANTLLGKKIPSFIGVEPYAVTHANLQKAWVDILKEKPPKELTESLSSTQAGNNHVWSHDYEFSEQKK
ncbi:LacI family DNA-binding transcriptional regulator [Effusibacillus consociatus]|uniref:LacI family DNA-binding transcriptional regulator n=1 Tax=Effusibacillus consociatus TaxID=1117041 RepID=A0ABV9PW99_9BACL